MVVELERGFGDLTPEISKDIEGYLGTWVTILYSPHIHESEYTYTGRFVGWASGGGTTLVFENYEVSVFSGKRFAMYGLNEDRD